MLLHIGFPVSFPLMKKVLHLHLDYQVAFQTYKESGEQSLDLQIYNFRPHNIGMYRSCVFFESDKILLSQSRIGLDFFYLDKST